jgi:hypothetical protein
VIETCAVLAASISQALKDGRKFVDLPSGGRKLQPHHPPEPASASGKNMSFQSAGGFFSVPTFAMKLTND